MFTFRNLLEPYQFMPLSPHHICNQPQSHSQFSLETDDEVSHSTCEIDLITEKKRWKIIIGCLYVESTVILLLWGDKKSQPNDRRDITVSDFQISHLVFSSVIRLKLYWDLFFLHQYDTKLEFRGSSVFDLSFFFFNFFVFFFAPGNTESLITPKHLGPKFPAEKNKLADHCRVNSYKLSICHQLLHFMSQRAARLSFRHF